MKYQRGQVLSAVDVIVEVRDARIPTATTHPMVDDWLKNRNAQRVVCMSKVKSYMKRLSDSNFMAMKFTTKHVLYL